MDDQSIINNHLYSEDAGIKKLCEERAAYLHGSFDSEKPGGRALVEEAFAEAKKIDAKLRARGFIDDTVERTRRIIEQQNT